MPIFVVVLALFAVPLARSEPRQSRYGGVLIAILVYIIGIALIFVGTALIGGGKLPSWLTFDATTLTLSGIPPQGMAPTDVTLQVADRTDSTAANTADK